MRAGILPLVLLAPAFGCSLFLATDDLAGGEGATPAANDGGGDGTTTPDVVVPASEGGGGGDGGVDAGKAKFGPLVFAESQASWKTRVDGFFELTFRSDNHKQLSEWVDLASGGVANIGGAPSTYQAPRARLGAGWYDAANASSSGVVDVVDSTPVFVSFNTYMHHFVSSDIDIKRWARFTVHATGRIVTEITVANGGTGGFTLDEWTYHDVSLSTQVGWTRNELASKSAYAFFPNNGGTSFTMINQAGETSSLGAQHEVRWAMPSLLFEQGDSVTKLGELQLGATMNDVNDRVGDVRNPALEVYEGGSASDSTYILATGEYSIPATSGTLKFGLGPTRARYYPTFGIKNFTSPSGTWKISLDGVVLASAQAPVTERAVAKYDAIKAALTFAYFGVVPANASPAQRTFVVER